MRKYLLSIFCAILLLPGCSYLDAVPEKDIETIESIFEQRTKVEMWWKALYSDVSEFYTDICTNIAYMGADEFVTCEALYNTSSYPMEGLKVAAGQQMSQKPYGSVWGFYYQVIRRCNIFIDKIDGTYNMEQAERDMWKADVKALKAFVYFDLMRHYGPICLVPENMPVDLDVKDYQLPRQHVDTCFKEITKLLDEAAEFVPMHSKRQGNYGHTFCLEAVYALKAKVLLYAASPLFNGNAFYSDFKNKNGELLFNATYDRNKWLLAAEAADVAADICDRGDRAMFEGHGLKKTEWLNHMYDVEMSTFSRFNNQEYLLEWKYQRAKWYSFTLPRLPELEKHFDNGAMGCLSPSMKMVEMYYTENGLPITADKLWTFDKRYTASQESGQQYEGVVPLNSQVIYLHLRREPRFYAHIAGDRMYWQRGVNTDSDGTDYNLLVEARKDETWGTSESTIVSNTWQNINGYWLKKHLFSWFPTMNYSSNLQGTETAAVLRVAEVFMMQAEAWNEYLETPDKRVYDPLDRVRKRAGILPVRDAWRDYAIHPEKVTDKVGMREIIRQEYNIEFAFEGHRYWNLRRWLIGQQNMNETQKGWNILGTTFSSFYINETEPIQLWSKNKFIAPRDYFDPLNAEEILISGMVQNPGW